MKDWVSDRHSRTTASTFAPDRSRKTLLFGLIFNTFVASVLQGTDCTTNFFNGPRKADKIGPLQFTPATIFISFSKSLQNFLFENKRQILHAHQMLQIRPYSLHAYFSK